MDFLKERRSLIAALAAGYAVWRYGRYLAAGWLQLHNLPFVDGPVRFLLERWEIAAVLGAVIFVGVFGVVRYALGHERRERSDDDGGGSPVDARREAPSPPETPSGGEARSLLGAMRRPG